MVECITIDELCEVLRENETKQVSGRMKRFPRPPKGYNFERYARELGVSLYKSIEQMPPVYKPLIVRPIPRMHRVSLFFPDVHSFEFTMHKFIEFEEQMPWLIATGNLLDENPDYEKFVGKEFMMFFSCLCAVPKDGKYHAPPYVRLTMQP